MKKAILVVLVLIAIVGIGIIVKEAAVDQAEPAVAQTEPTQTATVTGPTNPTLEAVVVELWRNSQSNINRVENEMASRDFSGLNPSVFGDVIHCDWDPAGEECAEAKVSVGTLDNENVIIASGDIRADGTCHVQVYGPGAQVDLPNGTFDLTPTGGMPEQVFAGILKTWKDAAFRVDEPAGARLSTCTMLPPVGFPAIVATGGGATPVPPTATPVLTTATSVPPSPTPDPPTATPTPVAGGPGMGIPIDSGSTLMAGNAAIVRETNWARKPVEVHVWWTEAADRDLEFGPGFDSHPATSVRDGWTSIDGEPWNSMEFEACKEARAVTMGSLGVRNVTVTFQDDDVPDRCVDP